MNALYDVFVVKQTDSTEDKLTETLRHHSNDTNDVLFVRQCVKNGKQDTFIVCMKKEMGAKMIEETAEDKNLTVLRYSVNRETLQYGQTWGYHIKCDEKTEKELEETFQKFEDNGFIHKGTYQFKKPKTQEGNRKPYVIITFKKKNDRYPKQFIRKLKGLIDYKKINGQPIKVNWIKYNNRNDQGQQTEQNTHEQQSQQPVEVGH